MTDSNKLNERPVAALRDEHSVEMLRAWIAERGLHCSIKVGMYRDSTNIREEDAWGMLLADVARHVSNALESNYGTDPRDALDKICESFLSEVSNPTTVASGTTVRKQ